MLEHLEDRWAPAGLTASFLGGSNPDSALASMSNAFVAEGRIGSSAYPGQNFTFETDVNKSTAGPFGPGQTADFNWSTSAGTPFTLSYDAGAHRATWTNGAGAGSKTVTYNNVVWDESNHDAITLRAASYTAGTSISLRDLQLTINGGATENILLPDGAADVHASSTGGSASKQVLLIQGEDLQQGFTLTGTSFWTYGQKSTKQSQLAFQVGVGDWNQAPTVEQTQVYAIAKDYRYVDMDLLNIATDPDGDPLTPIIVSQGNYGVVTYNFSTQMWDYQATTSQEAVIDSFRYKVSDGKLDSPVVKVDILAHSGPINPSFATFELMVDAPFDATGRPDRDRVAQQQINDCWLVAAAAGLAQQNPQGIVNMIVDNMNGTFTVTFPGQAAVTINNPIGDGDSWSTANDDWLAILEKAHGQKVYDAKFVTWGNTPRSYINQGNSIATGIAALTGSDTDTDEFWCTRDSTTRTKLQTAFANNRVVTACTSKSGGKKTLMDGIVKNHAYTVLQFDQANDRVLLRNPWGSNPLYMVNGQNQYRGQTDGLANNGQFWMPLPEFTKAFSEICYQE